MNESVNEQSLKNDDEIDLFDLIDDIWKHKTWVLVGLLSALMLAGIYLIKATPVYQAESTVKSATANDLMEFSRPQLVGVFSLDVESAFISARSALLSTDYRKEFYELKLDQIKAIPDSYNENFSIEQNFSRFNEQFSIKVSGIKDSEDYVKLTLKSADPVQASDLLNEFAEYALFRRLRDSYDTMLSSIDRRIELLNYQANIMREEYMSNKARRILELKEATVIAVAVGQTTPLYRNMDLVGGQVPPLYMLGSKAIKAEIKALESRELIAKNIARGEDRFIPGLTKILVEVEALQALEVDFSKISLARIDEVAVVPVKPIKPRKLLIMALALVGGVFVGLFMAIIVAASGKHKLRITTKRK